jgi:hypothetical protein
MYVLATTCWGKKVDKWDDTSPGQRFMVVKAVLEGLALPLALEAPSFTFTVDGPSRACFDQIARSRIGVVFSAKGMRDNNWGDCDFRIPSVFYQVGREEALITVVNQLSEARKTYRKLLGTDGSRNSWQAARAVLPLYTCYSWSMAINYQSLRSLCANRMKFCEMEDTVAVAWLLRSALYRQFPLLASYLRPGCDFTKKCTYHKAYHLSEVFGCLFKECGRHPCEATNGYAEFNETCTDPEELYAAGIYAVSPEAPIGAACWEELDQSDRSYFLKED